MKIAYFGSDLFIQCLDILRTHEHDIIAIFASKNDENNKQLYDYARENDIQYFTGKPEHQLIQNLENEGVDCFFSIEYDALIPIPSSSIMTINVHPTMLPEGRGVTPLSHLILQYPQHAGVTFHKLAVKFDEGDIILQSPMQLDAEEGLESLLIKLHYKIPQMLHQLLTDLPQLYQHAIPQTKGSYWPKLSDQDRILDWHDSIDNIRRMVRAFGRFGVVSCIGQEIWLVNHVETYKTSHTSPPGSILNHDHKICVVAALDGIIIIYTDSIIERRPQMNSD